MAENSSIEWTHHTFNPWIGCSKVSAGCANCYAAEMMDKRFGRVEWGPQGTREITSYDYWGKPYLWDRRAKLLKVRYRVFCGSLCDVFEGGRIQLDSGRAKLFKMIGNTTNLDWLLLTKRPQNILKMVPYKYSWPKNLWVGASIENQETLYDRLPYLLEVPAKVRFLSVEPMLGPIDLTGSPFWDWRYTYGFYPESIARRPIDWVIVGGESGKNARKMKPEWVQSLRDQCVVEGKVNFFFKQWGMWLHKSQFASSGAAQAIGAADPEVEWLKLHNKAAAGRLLDGRMWDQIPALGQ